MTTTMTMKTKELLRAGWLGTFLAATVFSGSVWAETLVFAIPDANEIIGGENVLVASGVVPDRGIPRTIVVRYNAECSVEGDGTIGVDTTITVDPLPIGPGGGGPVVLAPTNEINLLCSGAGAFDFNDNRVSALSTGVGTLPAGGLLGGLLGPGYRIEVRASGLAGFQWRLDDSVLTVETQP